MRGKPVYYNDFSGGLNSRDADYQIADTQARDVLNVISTPVGKLRKRDGMSTLGSIAETASGLFAAESTPARYLITTTVSGSTTKVYATDTSGTSRSIGTGYANAPWEWVSFPTASGQGPIFGMNGTDTPKCWTGATNSTALADWTANASNNLPNGKYVLAANNRIFVAGMSTYTPSGAGSAVSDAGSALVFSAIGDPRTWPAENVVLFDPNDGDAITGLGTVGPYLLVFKRRKIWVVYDLDTGANRRLATNLGTLSHRSIAESGPSVSTKQGAYGCFFFSTDRTVCVTDGQTVKEVSEVIDPTVKGIAGAMVSKTAGAVHNNRYYLSYSTNGTYNNYTLDLDLRVGGWWVHSVGVAEWARWRPTTVVNLYGNCWDPVNPTSNCYIAQAFVEDVAVDFGANFTSYWTSPWFTWGAPFQRKRVRCIRFDGTGPVDLYLAKNFASSESLFKSTLFSTGVSTTFGGTGTYGDGGLFGDEPSLVLAEAHTPGVARAFSFKLYAPSTNSGSWEMDSMTPLLTPRKN